MALCQLCPMHIQAQYSIAEGQALWAQHAELRADVERIEQIWAQRADEHTFLFGDFSIADAFYTPVVMRFKSYALPVSERSQQYMQHIMQYSAVTQWVDVARAEAV